MPKSQRDDAGDGLDGTDGTDGEVQASPDAEVTDSRELIRKIRSLSRADRAGDVR